MLYPNPGSASAPLQFKKRYDNFIGGQWVAPVKGEYLDAISPINGQVFTQVAQSTAEDIELALDAAHAAAAAWGATPAAERSNVLLRIADRLEANLEKLAYADTVDNGKPIRETLNADMPLTVDHFRLLCRLPALARRRFESAGRQHRGLPLPRAAGRGGDDHSVNFPILMAAWKLAPALAAGNCVVLKPAESTPVSIMVLMELIADLLPAGVLNIVNGLGREAGKALASSKRIAKSPLPAPR